MTVDKRVVTPDELVQRALNNLDKAHELFDEVLVDTPAKAALIYAHVGAIHVEMGNTLTATKGGKP